MADVVTTIDTSLVKELEQKLAGKRALFTDFFDTVVVRVVHPESTKRIAARHVASALGLTCDAEALYQLRGSLERDVCVANEQAGHDLDFRFDDRFLDRWYDAAEELGWLAPESRREIFRAACIEAEVETECLVQRLDEKIVAVLKEAKARSLQVHCVSDFYLPEALLRRVMAHHGIEELFDGVFVSSESLKTKRSGRLYDLVLGELGFEPSSVLMIGDNEHSDGRMAEEKGLASHLVDRAEQRAFYETAQRELLEADALGRLVVQTLKESCAVHSTSRSFFPPFALTLYRFIDGLHRRLLKAGVRDVFFLSREGEFLKKLFDRYQAAHHFGEISRIQSHYLLVSRKSTFIASLSALSDERFETLFRQYRALSLRDFLSNLNFVTEDIDALASELGVDADAREADLPTSAVFAALLASERFQQRYERLRTEQRELFCDYVASFGVDVARDGLALVDVGWKGTIQDHIHRVYQGNVTVDGYYLGLIAPGAASAMNRKEGVLFTLLPAHSPFFAVYNDNRPLFEILLGASHGSADRYVKTADGVTAATTELAQERQIFTEIIEPIQLTLLAVFEDLLSVLSRTHLTSDALEQLVAENHARLTFQPTPDEMAFFTRLHHYESFGVFGTSRFEVSESLPLGVRVKNLYHLAKAPRQTLQSGWWPPLTLEQLGLGFLRPAYGTWRFKRTFGKALP